MSDPIIAIFFFMAPNLDAIRHDTIDCENRTIEIEVI